MINSPYISDPYGHLKAEMKKKTDVKLKLLNQSPQKQPAINKIFSESTTKRTHTSNLDSYIVKKSQWQRIIDFIRTIFSKIIQFKKDYLNR